MKELKDILGLRSDPAPEAAARRLYAAPGPEAPGQPPADHTLTRLRMTGYGVIALLASCATASTPGAGAPALPVMTSEQRALSFSLTAPDMSDLGAPLALWATHYHTPSVRPAAPGQTGSLALLNRSNQPISPPLSQRDWCEAALQGSVAVREAGDRRAFVFIDSKGPEQTHCDSWLGSLPDAVKIATRRARFMEVNHPLGCDARNHPLVPFRTIAVDPSMIPLGSVLFVPELRGRTFRTDERTWVHDGYLFAGDRGGAIRGAHIDVFTAEDESSSLEDLFASTPDRTFNAHLVTASNPDASALLTTQKAGCAQARSVGDF